MRIYIQSIIIFLVLMGNVQGETLGEIHEFAENICDRVSSEGEITRSKIIARLNAESGAVAKLIGADLGADGSITIENTTYKGLPYSDLSEQMKDSRACKKEIAYFLLSKRQEIIEYSAHINQTVGAMYRVITNGDRVYLMTNPNFKKFIEINGNPLKICNLSENTWIDVVNDEYIEKTQGIEIPWYKVSVSSGKCSGKIGWIPERNIAQK